MRLEDGPDEMKPASDEIGQLAGLLNVELLLFVEFVRQYMCHFHFLFVFLQMVDVGVSVVVSLCDSGGTVVTLIGICMQGIPAIAVPIVEGTGTGTPHIQIDIQFHFRVKIGRAHV